MGLGLGLGLGLGRGGVHHSLVGWIVSRRRER